jgi:hypothetical protein
MRAITVSRAEHIAIGELSRLSGVNIETIRYYERIKMLPAPQRPRAAGGLLQRSRFKLRKRNGCRIAVSNGCSAPPPLAAD